MTIKNFEERINQIDSKVDSFTKRTILRNPQTYATVVTIIMLIINLLLFSYQKNYYDTSTRPYIYAMPIVTQTTNMDNLNISYNIFNVGRSPAKFVGTVARLYNNPDSVDMPDISNRGFEIIYPNLQLYCQPDNLQNKLFKDLSIKSPFLKIAIYYESFGGQKYYYKAVFAFKVLTTPIQTANTMTVKYTYLTCWQDAN